MKIPWNTFTNYKETIKEIGMNVLYRMKYDPREIAES